MTYTTQAEVKIAGQASFASLETYMLEKGDVTPNASGRQEFLENLINEFF